MTPIQIKKRLSILDKKISTLYAERKFIVDNCPHEGLVTTRCGVEDDYGAWTPFWYPKYKCPVCGKQWNGEDQRDKY